MAMHARSGGQIEVMGLLQGRAQADGTFVVLDCFALPVEGTETRVNAQAEAYEYMVAFVDASRKAGKGATHNVVGWYHSHPGYGCWLSGIDVGTQMLNQTYQEPWLAVVVDPVRTMASGKVEVRVGGGGRPLIALMLRQGPRFCRREDALSFSALSLSHQPSQNSKNPKPKPQKNSTARRLPHLPRGLHRPLHFHNRRRRLPDHPAVENRGFRRPRAPLLPFKRELLQVRVGWRFG